jgi:hypothetical protein
MCDDTSTSPFYGKCYTEFDNNSRNDLVLMSTSADGGLTWGRPKTTGDAPDLFSIPARTLGAHGIVGQPLAQHINWPGNVHAHRRRPPEQRRQRTDR